MTRQLIPIFLVACLAQCGGQPAPPAEEAPAVPEPIKRMTMSGMDFYLHDDAPTHGGARKPTFWVHAEEAALEETENIWSLQQTRAVIYGEEESQVTLEATHGRLDQTNKTALLWGDVSVTAGAVSMELSEIEWDNEEGLARSDAPLTITDGETKLRADTLVLDPNRRTFVLTGVRGRLGFPGENS